MWLEKVVGEGGLRRWLEKAAGEGGWRMWVDKVGGEGGLRRWVEESQARSELHLLHFTNSSFISSRAPVYVRASVCGLGGWVVVRFVWFSCQADQVPDLHFFISSARCCQSFSAPFHKLQLCLVSFESSFPGEVRASVASQFHFSTVSYLQYYISSVLYIQCQARSEFQLIPFIRFS